MRRLLLLTLALLPCVVLLPLATTEAQEARCFPETGHCINGRFRTFWEQGGGLAVFGYPITTARDEVNRDTGQIYLTQWFERNRFELHPEIASPSGALGAVLLGRLGDDRLRQLERSQFQTEREPAPLPGCLWFEETGHNLCDVDVGRGFMSYWQSNRLGDPALDSYGQSLALWGLPLSGQHVETNASGDTVLTQWFERGRMEWHPNNPDAHKVLLGLLGVEAGASAIPVMGTPVPTATVAPTVQPSAPPSPTPTGVPSPTPAPPPAVAPGDEALKEQMFALVDPLHQQAGCAPFVRDSRLAAAAQAHAEDIAAHRRVDHVGTDGATLRERLQRVSYPYNRASESIAVSQSPEQAVEMWMDEPPNGPHRLNITNCQYVDVGIGMAYDSRGRRWWVMDVANQRR